MLSVKLLSLSLARSLSQPGVGFRETIVLNDGVSVMWSDSLFQFSGKKDKNKNPIPIAG